MIHAMMSEAGSGGRERSHVVSTFGALAADQQRAEAEARRVLAVAEPRTTAWSDDGMIEMPSCHGYTAVYAQLAVHGVADVGAILAEALSAFVGAADPADYLAAVSR